MKDAISGSGNGVAYIVMTDYTGVCALGDNLKANSKGILFDFLTTATLSVGTVNVGSDLDVQYATYDATCNSPSGESATSGSVVITHVDASGVQGTFDITFSSDHVTGSFDTAACASSLSGSNSGCM